MEIDNRFMTVAYRLYTIEDGEEDEEPVEVANRRHPFQFITKLGLVLPKFEEQIGHLEQGGSFQSFIRLVHDLKGEAK